MDSRSLIIVAYPGIDIRSFVISLVGTYNLQNYEIIEINKGFSYEITKPSILLTHSQPSDFEEIDDSVSIVYLLAHGLISFMSKVLHEKGAGLTSSNLNDRLSESIIGLNPEKDLSWFEHFIQWLPKCSIVIRLEDLCDDQFSISSLDKIRFFAATKRKVAFDARLVSIFIASIQEVCDRLPDELKAFFWSVYKTPMSFLGYRSDNSKISYLEFNKGLKTLIDGEEKSKSRVLIESTKLAEKHNDGIKRYVHTLLSSLYWLKIHQLNELSYYVRIFDRTYSLAEAREHFISIEEKCISQNKKVINIGWPDECSKSSWPRVIKSKIGLFLFKIGLVELYYKLLKSFHGISNYDSEENVKKPEESFDLIHFTLPQIMDIWAESDKHVVTIHDITHISHSEFHLSDNVRQAQKGFDIIERIRPYIISVSKSTQDQLVENNITEKDKLKLLYEAIDHNKFYAIYDERIISKTLDKYGLKNTKYLFCLATSEPRKNLKNTAKAFLELIKLKGNEHLKLVVGGKPGWKSETLPEHESIIYTGYIEDEDLCALYNGALGFCFISHHEGFGLPPLEAMRCKTVPVYGDNSAMRELIGEYGIPANPNSIEDMCEKMHFIVSNEQTIKKMELEAYLYSLQFSIPGLAEQSEHFYQEVLLSNTGKNNN